MAQVAEKIRNVLKAKKDFPRDAAESVTAVVELIEQDPGKGALLARELRAINNMTCEASEKDVLSALSAASDHEALVRTLHDTGSKIVELVSPSQQSKTNHNKAFAAAEARGVAVKSEILNREGPPLESSEAQKKLRVSRTALLWRRKAGIIIALHSGRHGFLYPNWQFGEGEYGFVPGLFKVLRILGSMDPWAKSIFLLKKHPAIRWRTPLDLLKQGQTEKVLELAKSIRVIRADVSKRTSKA